MPGDVVGDQVELAGDVGDDPVGGAHGEQHFFLDADRPGYPVRFPAGDETVARRDQLAVRKQAQEASLGRSPLPEMPDYERADRFVIDFRLRTALGERR